MIRPRGLYISYTFHVSSSTLAGAPRIDGNRLMDRLRALGAIGSTGDGGCARLALTDDDRAGRDLVVEWMRDLGLEISMDVVGNVIGIWKIGEGAPVMTGSHIDTVRTGGIYDGNLGVLAGLEVIERLQELGITPARSIAVAFFTNEEGARFAPDMLGSLVYVGGMPVESALEAVSIDGARLGNELERIGYNGSTPCPGMTPHAFVELHIEQGPLLEQRGVRVGAVTGVQGISWQEISVHGQSNHAGTTPMALRHDPAFVASSVAVHIRQLADRMGGHQVCTVGKIDLHPNLINVIPARATFTVDIRNTSEQLLQQAEQEVAEFVADVANREGVTVETRVLARFEPVEFDERVVSLVEETARAQGHDVLRMPSGAGHDAQMLARVCPTAMIFVPSEKGISHNPAEFTAEEHIEAGANILLSVMLSLTTMEWT